jgi:hypothetical protein
MAKKSPKVLTKQQHHKRRKQHKALVGIVIVFLAVVIGLILVLTIPPKINNDLRLRRINQIYSSIELPANTYFNTQNIFGDKRPYPYDKGRSFSSQKSFVVAKTVTETTDIMDKAIKAAGYTFFEEAYPGSTSKEYHYKTSRGEYIRLSVSSKLRDDAASSEVLMNGKFDDAFFKIDPNAGPSSVILKVNLDDNNE